MNNIDLQLDNDDDDNGFIIVSNNEFKANYSLYIWRQIKSVTNKKNLILFALLVLFYFLNNLLLFKIITYQSNVQHDTPAMNEQLPIGISESDYRDALDVIGKQKSVISQQHEIIQQFSSFENELVQVKEQIDDLMVSLLDKSLLHQLEELSNRQTDLSTKLNEEIQRREETDRSSIDVQSNGNLNDDRVSEQLQKATDLQRDLVSALDTIDLYKSSANDVKQMSYSLLSRSSTLKSSLNLLLESSEQTPPSSSSSSSSSECVVVSPDESQIRLTIRNILEEEFRQLQLQQEEQQLQLQQEEEKQQLLQQQQQDQEEKQEEEEEEEEERQLQQQEQVIPSPPLDFATSSEVVRSASSATYCPVEVCGSGPGIGTLVRYLGIDVAGVGRPEWAIDPDVKLGQCWPFAGSSGNLTLRLSEPVWIQSVSLEHTGTGSDDLTMTTTVSSAPRDIQIFGFDSSLSDTPRSLVSGTFQGQGHLQNFVVDQEVVDMQKLTRFITLSVLNNHGNEDYTCVYRLRVHGIPLSVLRHTGTIQYDI